MKDKEWRRKRESGDDVEVDEMCNRMTMTRRIT